MCCINSKGGPEILRGKCMLPKEKRRIQTRLDRVADKLIDLCLELRDLKFPQTAPIMKDVDKMKVYLKSCIDHLDLSIQMRDDSLKWDQELPPGGV